MENIYVIYGEEQFKINTELNKLIENSKGADIIKYDMKQTQLIEVIIEASTMSILNEKKLIICDNSYFLTGSKTTADEDEEDLSPTTNAKAADQLIKYIAEPNDNSILIFTVKIAKLDDRKKLVKQLKIKSKIIICSKTNYADSFSFIKTSFSKEGYQISDLNIKLLLGRIGNNPSNIENEINKLQMYKLEDKTITEDDIEALVNKQIDEDIFQLINNLIAGNKDDALMIYNELIIKGEFPTKILVMIANQFRLIYQVKELSRQGFKEFEIATKLGSHPYPIKLAKEKAYKFSDEQLKNYLEQLADLDSKMKTSKTNKYLGLELFFLNM